VGKLFAFIEKNDQKRRDDMGNRKQVISVIIGIVALFMPIIVSDVLAASPGQPIQLTYATIWPAMHPYAVGDQRWIDYIEKETKGAVKIKPYYGGTLISPRESMLEATSGVADIVCINVVYEKSGVDLTKAQTAFYQGAPDFQTKLKIFWVLWNKFPELRNEFKNMKILGVSAVTSLRLMSKAPINSLADFKGVRMKAPVETLAVLKHYGAEGVVIPTPEAAEQLQKGIIKAAFSTAESYKAARLAEVVKYDINLTTIMGPFPEKAMSLKSWDKLPKDIQKIFEQSGDKWTMFQLEEVEKTAQAGLEFAKQSGITFLEMPSKDIQAFNAVFDEEAMKSAQALDAKGLPGTKMFQEAKQIIKESQKK
jgi:TRAP-type C4-dicarboxylate transport system substrate-binding protein